MNHVTVAAAQVEIHRHDVDANLAQARTLAAQAASDAGAQLIVFPEAALTGPVSDAPELWDTDGRLVAAWQEIARDAAIDIVTGSIVIKEDGLRRNRTYYVDRNGDVLGHHDKARLWKTELPATTPGETVTVVQAAFGNVGLSICWDITDSGFIGSLAQAGADIIAVPAYWCTALAGPEVRHSTNAEATHVDAMCVTRAFEHCVAVMFVNAAGDARSTDPEAPKVLLGRSQIAVPFKGAIARLGSAPGLITADIDLGLLDDARDLYGLGRAQVTTPTH